MHMNTICIPYETGKRHGILYEPPGLPFVFGVWVLCDIKSARVPSWLCRHKSRTRARGVLWVSPTCRLSFAVVVVPGTTNGTHERMRNAYGATAAAVAKRRTHIANSMMAVAVDCRCVFVMKIGAGVANRRHDNVDVDDDFSHPASAMLSSLRAAAAPNPNTMCCVRFISVAISPAPSLCRILNTKPGAKTGAKTRQALALCVPVCAEHILCHCRRR